MLLFIVGKKRSGKDTALKAIEQEHKTHYYKLASPIKNALYRADNNDFVGITSEQWDGVGYDREKYIPLNNKDVYELMKTAFDYLPELKISPFEQSLKEVILNNKEAWSVRRLMQTLGTDLVVNHFDRMYWIKRFAIEYVDFVGKQKEGIFIVPDTRQDHELAFARAMGAIVIHIVRDSNSSDDTHITEAGLPIKEGDIVVENNGTLEEFNEKIKEVICQLKK